MKPENKQILDRIDVLTTQELESTGSGVISGLTVTTQSTPDMTVNVASGIVHMPNGTRLTPTGNSALTITTADTTNPRIDIIYVNTDSTIGYIEGIPSSSPVIPDTPSDTFLLVQINVEANVTSIIDSYIIDKRIIKTNLVLHETKFATETDLGHVKQGTGISIDAGGVLNVATGSAAFKNSSSTFTTRGTSQVFTDVFCTANSLVTIAITSSTNPQGTWIVNSADGSFTITSTVSETEDITFDYYIQKAVI